MKLPIDHLAAFRILDANANRTAEGLRTLEEIFRFLVEDGLLTGQIKQLRHDFQKALSQLDSIELLAARNTAGDVGTEISTSSEQNRQSVLDIAAAATQRVQQSLRCMEEFSKLVDPAVAEPFEKLRYQAYDLFASALRRLVGVHDGLASASLYVLVDCSLSIELFLSRLIELSQAGVDLFQIRDKGVDDAQLLAYSKAAVAAIADTGSRVIINDRIDIAILSGAAGVHLGQNDLPIREARKLVGAHHWIGISTHSLDQAIEAQQAGTDYIGCGPTFPSTTKKFDAFPGIEFLRQVQENIHLPAFAIGGITLENLEQVVTAGITRIAVNAAVWNARQPIDAAREFAIQLQDKSNVAP